MKVLMTKKTMTIEIFRKHLEYNPVTGKFINRQTRCNRAAWGTVVEGYDRGKTKYPVQIFKFRNVKYNYAKAVWFYHYGFWPQVVRFLDGNRLNTRLDNLRTTNKSFQQLTRGARVTNKLGIKHVSFDKKKALYVGSITVQNVTHRRANKDLNIVTKWVENAVSNLHSQDLPGVLPRGLANAKV
jgi:hypothetical protein